MKQITRAAALMAATTLALTLSATPAHAEASSPDVHAVGFDTYCGNRATVYEVRLVNFGDQRRGVRARITRGHGWSETFSRRIPAGRTVTEAVRLGYGQRAVLTLRSQGQVIARIRMHGTCQRVH